MDEEGVNREHENAESSAFLCRTVIERLEVDEHGVVRDVKRKFLSGHRGNRARVYYANEGCTRITRRSGTVGFKYEEEGRETIVYAGRTNVREETRAPATNRRGSVLETVRCKSYGRVRTNVVVRETIEDGNKDGGELGRSGEMIEIIEVPMEHVSGTGRRENGSGRRDGGECTGGNVGNNLRQMRRKRRRKRSEGDDGGGVNRRKRRRCEISLYEFRMFGQNGEQLDSRNTASSSVSMGLSEEDKFRKSIRATQFLFPSLQHSWRDAPFLRCSGGSRREQKFICVGTTRMKRILYGGGCRVSVLLSLVVQEESKKFRTLTVRREAEGDGGDVDRGMTVNCQWICSCDIRRTGNSIEDSSCWHIGCLKSDSVIVEQISRILDCGFMDDHTLYYGTSLDIKETGPHKKFMIEGIESECENGIIAVQLDDVKKEDLLRKGRSVKKNWSIWLTVDPSDGLMVSVLWKAVNSGDSATRMICGTCRSETSRKCIHEVACEMESVKVVDDSDSSDCYDVDRDDDDIPGVPETNEVSDGGDADEGQSRNPDNIQSGVGDNLEAGTGGDEDIVHDFRAVNESKCYLPKGPRRPIFFCPSERRKATALTDLIETREEGAGSLIFHDPDGIPCGGIMKSVMGNTVQCKNVRKVSIDDKTRRCTLITLNHGAVGILVMDWVCNTCTFLNRYVGYSHGIFPVSRGIAFSVELIYYWISELSNSTRSFRSVYATTSKLSFTTSYDRRYVTGRFSKLSAWHKGNRRLGNDAVRRYIQLIDVDKVDVAGQIFTCKKCEVEMDGRDFQQLGIDGDEHKGEKRLRSVVIDAKVIGLLKDGGTNGDRHDVLAGAKGMSARIVTKRPTQNAIALFVRLVRNCITKCRNARAAGRLQSTVVEGSNDGDDSDEVTFGSRKEGMFIKDGFLFMRLADMARLPSKKGKASLPARKLHEYISTIKWFLDNCGCICMEPAACLLNSCGQRPLQEGVTDVLCQELRTTLRKTKGCTEATYALGKMFANWRDILGESRTVNSASPVGGGDRNVDDTAESGVDSDASSSDDGSQPSVRNALDWAQVRVGEYFKIEYQLDTYMEVVGFCLTEPISLGFFPYTSGGSTSNNDRAGTSSHPGIDSSDNDIRGLVTGLASEAVGTHRRAVTELEKVATCTHEGIRTDQWICSLCSSEISELNKVVTAQNGVLGMFIDESLQYGPSNPVFTRHISRVVSYLFQKRVSAFEQYMTTLSRKLDKSCLEYWRMFGRIDPTPVSSTSIPGVPDVAGSVDSTVSNTAYIFPGRKRVRNGITFEQVDKQECTKHYFKRGNTVVPSFLTVQSACAHPKLIGFVLLSQCESISAALSSVVTHFAAPPRVIWYDNACNTYDSGLLRIPWLLRWSRLVVDRFHYKGHNCSNMFNGDLQRSLDGDRSVAAEVINSIINKGASHIAYLDGDNVKPFMKVIFAYVNATAAVRDLTGKGDLEDEDVDKIISDMYTCHCASCMATGGPEATSSVPDGVAMFTTANEVEDIDGV